MPWLIIAVSCLDFLHIYSVHTNHSSLRNKNVSDEKHPLSSFFPPTHKSSQKSPQPWPRGKRKYPRVCPSCGSRSSRIPWSSSSFFFSLSLPSFTARTILHGWLIICKKNNQEISLFPVSLTCAYGCFFCTLMWWVVVWAYVHTHVSVFRSRCMFVCLCVQTEDDG